VTTVVAGITLAAPVAWAETPVQTVDGTFERRVSDPAPRDTTARPVVHNFVRDAKGRLVSLQGSPELFDHLVPGQRVSARGPAAGASAAKAANASQALRTEQVRPLAAAAAPDVTGVQTHAVILLRLGPSGTEAISPEETRRVFFTADDSVSAYFRESSWSKLDLRGRDRADGDVHGYLEIPADTGCWGEETAGRAAAQAAGIDLGRFDKVTFLLDGAARACGYGGWAWIGGQVNVNVYPGYAREIAYHELGHTFGLLHAHSLVCRTGDGRYTPIEADGSTCTTEEYGDQFDAMGNAYNGMQFSANNKAALGWIGASGVTTVTGSGTYPIAASEIETGRPQNLRVPISDGAYYDIDFRRPYGRHWDAKVADYPALMNGVTIRRVDASGLSLVDTTPDGDVNDAALQTGRTFTDAAHGIAIRTESVGDDTAQVRVDYLEHQQMYLRGTHNGWAAGPMTKVAGARDLWTAEARFAGQPSPRFKFDVTGDWSENYGDADRDGIADRGGADITVPRDNVYTITFDALTKRYTVRGGPLGNYPAMTVRGTHNGWATTPMTLTDDHTWRTDVTFTTARERFKFDVDGTWATNFGDVEQDGTAERNAPDIIGPAAPGTYRISFYDDYHRYTVEQLS
jgi:hypothetical protein